MAFVYSDRVKEQSSSIGLTSMVLSGAFPGFQTFLEGIADTNQTYYTIVNDADSTWEVGSGIYTAGSNSISRDTVLASSNSNNPVNFAAGTKTVFSTVAAAFFGAVLTAVSHATLNHTGIPGIPGPESFTNGDHDLVNHTTIPFQLLDVPAHEGVNHTIAPFNLLTSLLHAGIDHTGLSGVNPFDVIQHALEDHAGVPGIPPAETFTNPIHAVTDHTGIPGVGGGGGTPLQVATFSPSTFQWNAGNAAIDTNGLAFTPVVAIAFATFHFSSTLAVGSRTSISVGVATSGNAYSHGASDENSSDGNDVITTYASGAIAGISNLDGNFPPYRSAWDLATINVNAFSAAGIILQPSAALTGNLTLIVLGS